MWHSDLPLAGDACQLLHVLASIPYSTTNLLTVLRSSMPAIGSSAGRHDSRNLCGTALLGVECWANLEAPCPLPSLSTRPAPQCSAWICKPVLCPFTPRIRKDSRDAQRVC